MRQVLVPVSIAEGAPPAGSRLLCVDGRSMGTTWSVQLAGELAQLADAVTLVLDEVVSQMSHWEANSDLSRYNSAPAGSWHRLPAGLLHVLGAGIEVGRRSGGAFNPFAGALADLWGFGAYGRFAETGCEVPDEFALDAARALAVRALGDAAMLDRERALLLQPGGGLALDLSAIAKGYAVDQAARMLESRGVAHYLVEIGGELRGAGMKPDGQPWWVELEALPGAGEPPLVALHGLSVATSGDYRRYREVEGERLPHTIDPRTGRPIANGVASVTVFHRDCMLADALSTALTVMGPDEGMPFAEREGIPARMLVREAGGIREYTSSRYLEMLQ